jgi:hypothetical protein
VGIWLPAAITVVVSILGSQGLWTYLHSRTSKSSQTERLLRGLAYAEIVNRGMIYIERGWITQDEYEEYLNYLYAPYKEMGGNGAAERMMSEISGLPFKAPIRYIEMIQDTNTRRLESEPIEQRGNAA